MAALVVIRNAVAVAAFAALVWAVVRKVAPSIKGLIDKRSEYYDVERMDDAEILARKYDVKGRGRHGKR